MVREISSPPCKSSLINFSGIASGASSPGATPLPTVGPYAPFVSASSKENLLGENFLIKLIIMFLDEA